MKLALRALLALVSTLAITMTVPGPAHAGSAPALSWAPSTGTAAYDYGTVDVGSESVQTFTLSNGGGSGTSALKITLGGSSAYSITQDTCSGTSLGPRKSCTVTVTYAPVSGGGTDTATLTATSNKAAARATHTLTGSATHVVVGSLVITHGPCVSTGGNSLSCAPFDVVGSDLQPGAEVMYCVPGESACRVSWGQVAGDGTFELHYGNVGCIPGHVMFFRTTDAGGATVESNYFTCA
ncbi:hypothetical protein [Auraticoccus cholistanensis]|uniref:hypothetical protein n=1 Tax=Auraticoccus cholistanensis TaxID=2656650 RepID=UPI0018D26960